MDKRTLLFEEHTKLGAKMTSFAGWEMPVNYVSIIDEHNAVRNNVGIFDVSHMGEFFVKGVDSLKLLQKIVPQDISKLENAKAVYCQLTNKTGGMIDDLIIYKWQDNDYMIIVNASRVEDDFNWIVKNAENLDVVVDNKSDDYCLFAIQGPKATDLIEKMGLAKDLQPKFFTIKKANFKGIDVSISRTGYTGEDGFEILVKNEFAVKMWKYIFEIGKEFDLKPIGLGARDTLRLEAALHLYGNDMDETITPVEAGLTWSVSKTKTEDYNGKDVIFKQIQNGVDKKLVGFEMVQKAIPRHNYELFKDNEKIGHVTSGGVSISSNKMIGMGYVETAANIEIGSTIQVKIRDKFYDALVVKRPFVSKKYTK